ncbi:MAG TPA: TonB-dependent receptor [Prolixibacteraceae bacterium]|nr:TonB-dependent receptor [Prolixibacteraceae bacterium]
MKNLIHLYRRKPATQKILLTMRLTLFLLIASVFSAFSNTYAQKTKLDINVQNRTVKDVLNEIETQSEFFFMYNNKQVDVERIVNLDAKSTTVDIVLEKLFAGTDVNFKVVNRQILLFPNNLINLAEQQGKKVSGKVTDQNGVAIPGAAVVVRGTTTGASSDNDGSFSLVIPTDAKALIISFVGMKSQEIVISGKTIFNIVLEEETIGLEEVVAIGYGTVKKSDITGSVSSVKANKLKDASSNSFDQMLQGQAAGVVVSQSSSAPGGGVSVRIRGSNSINGGNEPLYVIDGMPIYKNDGDAFGGHDYGSSGAPNVLSTIDPNDIESMEILKDASATAIYGARGANGVVLITTKKGQIGKSNIIFNASYALAEVAKKYNMLNASQFAQLNNDARIAGGDKPLYDLNNLGNIDTDWQNEIFRVAPTQNYQLQMTGGDEKIRYMISGGYFNQQGIIKSSGMDRYSLRVNFERSVSKRIKIGENLTISRSNNNDGNATTVLYNALKRVPTSPVYIDGTTELASENDNIHTDLAGTQNPFYKMNLCTNAQTTNKLLGNIFAEITLLDGLMFKTDFGATIQDIKGVYFEPADLSARASGAGIINNNYTINTVIQNTLNYNKSFSKHNIAVVLGQTAEKYEYESNHVRGEGMSNITTVYNNMAGNYMTSNIIQSNIGGFQMASFLGRVTYGFDSKYLLTSSVRKDGSSRFGKNNKWGYFPSAAAAWVVSKEDFMQNQTIISNLKFRLSYGATGNQEIGNYNSMATLGSWVAIINNQNVKATYPDRIANADLKWETTKQFNGGIDLGIIKGRISLIADYFNKTTSDLLYYKPVPLSTGFGSILSNIGSVENKGFELGLNSVNLDGNFKWNTGITFTLQKNKILSLGGQPAAKNEPTILQEGEELGTWYGYLTDGVITDANHPAQPDAKIGDVKFKDIAGPLDANNKPTGPDGKIDGNDRTVLGHQNPNVLYSLTNDFTYKGFELNVFFNGVSGNTIYNQTRQSLEDLSGKSGAVADVLNRYNGTNPGTSIPRALQNGGTNHYGSGTNTKFLENGSYLKLRNLTLAYNLPAVLSKKIFVSNFRVYFSGQNLWTSTKYSGYDPDVSAYDNFAYPSTKIYTVGINLTF